MITATSAMSSGREICKKEKMAQMKNLISSSMLVLEKILAKRSWMRNRKRKKETKKVHGNHIRERERKSKKRRNRTLNKRKRSLRR